MRNDLTAEKVKEIRKEYKLEVVDGSYKATNLIELAKRYGLSQSTIRNIANRKTYAWVND